VLVGGKPVEEPGLVVDEGILGIGAEGFKVIGEEKISVVSKIVNVELVGLNFSLLGLGALGWGRGDYFFRKGKVFEWDVGNLFFIRGPEGNLSRIGGEEGSDFFGKLGEATGLA